MRWAVLADRSSQKRGTGFADRDHLAHPLHRTHVLHPRECSQIRVPDFPRNCLPRVPSLAPFPSGPFCLHLASLISFVKRKFADSVRGPAPVLACRAVHRTGERSDLPAEGGSHDCDIAAIVPFGNFTGGRTQPCCSAKDATIATRMKGSRGDCMRAISCIAVLQACNYRHRPRSRKREPIFFHLSPERGLVDSQRCGRLAAMPGMLA